MNEQQHIHIIGRADAFAARNTEMYLNEQTGEVYYYPFGIEDGHKIGVIVESDPKIQALVQAHYDKRFTEPQS